MKREEVLKKAMELASLYDVRALAEGETYIERYGFTANLWTDYIRAGIPDHILDTLDDIAPSAAVISPTDVALMQALYAIADAKNKGGAHKYGEG